MTRDLVLVGGKRLFVFGRTGGALLEEIQMGGPVRAIDETTERLYVTTFDTLYQKDVVMVLDLKDRDPLYHREDVRQVAFLGRTRRMDIMGGPDGLMRVVKPPGGELQFAFRTEAPAPEHGQLHLQHSKTLVIARPQGGKFRVLCYVDPSEMKTE